MADATQPVSELPDKGPADDTALSASEGENALAALLDDQGDDLDPVNGHEDTKAEPSTFDEDDAPEDVAPDDTPADDDPQDDETPYEGGRFASDNAKVTLDDGTVITVAQLKRNNLFQRDYSKKTEELARERETYQTKASQVEQTAQQLHQEREYLKWFAETYAPDPPQPPTVPVAVNPMAHLQYEEQKRAYDTFAQSYYQMLEAQKAEQERNQGETAKQRQDRLKSEAEKLSARYKILNDPQKRQMFWSETFENAHKFYGMSREEAEAELVTAKQVEILRDAIAYRRMKAKAPEVQKQVTQAPRIITGSTQKRSDPRSLASRNKQQSMARLSETGSPRDAEAVLMNMDL